MSADNTPRSRYDRTYSGPRDLTDSRERDILRRRLTRRLMHAKATNPAINDTTVSVWTALMEETLAFRWTSKRVSHGALAEYAAVAPRTVRKHVAALEAAGFIRHLSGTTDGRASCFDIVIPADVRAEVTMEMDGNLRHDRAAGTENLRHSQTAPCGTGVPHPAAQPDRRVRHSQTAPCGTGVPPTHESSHEKTHEKTHEGGHEARSARAVGASTSDRHLGEGAGTATTPTPETTPSVEAESGYCWEGVDDSPEASRDGQEWPGAEATGSEVERTTTGSAEALAEAFIQAVAEQGAGQAPTAFQRKAVTRAVAVAVGPEVGASPLEAVLALGLAFAEPVEMRFRGWGQAGDTKAEFVSRRVGVARQVIGECATVPEAAVKGLTCGRMLAEFGGDVEALRNRLALDAWVAAV